MGAGFRFAPLHGLSLKGLSLKGLSLKEESPKGLCLLVALPAEARPLREFFRLEAEAGEPGPFGLFAGEDVVLVTTGIGKIAMAAACGYLAARVEGPALWLNVGIAGHRDLDLGSPILAHQIRDRATGRTFYPPLVFDPPCVTGTVETVDRPEFEYPEPHAYDMEASAFVEIAQKVAGAELAQVLKVVSDRSREDLGQLSRATVGERVAGLLPQIEALRRATTPLIATLAAAAGEPPLWEELLEGRHFTWSDRQELRRLLRRKEALVPGQTLPAEVLTASRGRELNRRLVAWLATLPVLLPGAGL